MEVKPLVRNTTLVKLAPWIQERQLAAMSREQFLFINSKSKSAYFYEYLLSTFCFIGEETKPRVV